MHDSMQMQVATYERICLLLAVQVPTVPPAPVVPARPTNETTTHPSPCEVPLARTDSIPAAPNLPRGSLAGMSVFALGAWETVNGTGTVLGADFGQKGSSFLNLAPSK